MKGIRDRLNSNVDSFQWESTANVEQKQKIFFSQNFPTVFHDSSSKTDGGTNRQRGLKIFTLFLVHPEEISAVK